MGGGLVTLADEGQRNALLYEGAKVQCAEAFGVHGASAETNAGEYTYLRTWLQPALATVGTHPLLQRDRGAVGPEGPRCTVGRRSLYNLHTHLDSNIAPRTLNDEFLCPVPLQLDTGYTPDLELMPI